MLAGYQTYIFSNGKKIDGLYNHGTGKFTGLSKLCSIVGIANFSAFNLILFSYEDKWSTTVSVFDDHFVEVIFPGTPLSIGSKFFHTFYLLSTFDISTFILFYSLCNFL